MMSERCSPIEELERMAGLPADDPRRQHLDRCPRCRSLLKACRAFETEPDSATAGQNRDLDARLAAAVDGAIFGQSVSRAIPVEDSRPPLPGGRRFGWWRDLSFGRSALRIAAVAAAVVLILLGVQQTRSPHLPGTEESLLRGGGQFERDAWEAQARLIPDAWIFSWSPVRDADAYRLVLYDADVVEVTHFLATGSDSGLNVSPADLPASAGGSRVVFWRVIAFRRADEIARSRLQSLPLP